MKSDKDSDLFSADTDVTDTTELIDITKPNDGNAMEIQSNLRALHDLFNVLMLQMCSLIESLLAISRIIPAVKKRRRALKRKRKSNVHRDRRSVIRFIHSWSDDMFRRQFRVSREDFSLLENAIFEKMERRGYDVDKHTSYAIQSSGSAITLELRLYITLRILSGTSYLDMIWYAVEVRSVPGIFWRTICDLDEAVDNINFPTDEVGLMQLVDNWSMK